MISENFKKIFLYTLLVVVLLFLCSAMKGEEKGEIHFAERPDLIEFYTNKYGDRAYVRAMFAEDYSVEEKQVIKGIDKKGSDTVFVLPAISFPNGDSYYFYDTSLPRIVTESVCCHPENLATIEDLDEDGYNEVVLFYSSCSSRYKSLRVLSLQDGEWVRIGEAVFDILTKDREGVTLSDLVKKIKKDEFGICNFYNGKTYWENFNLK